MNKTPATHINANMGQPLASGSLEEHKIPRLDLAFPDMVSGLILSVHRPGEKDAVFLIHEHDIP